MNKRFHATIIFLIIQTCSVSMAIPCQPGNQWVTLKHAKNMSSFSIKNGKVFPGGDEDPQPLKDVDVKTFEVLNASRTEKCSSFWGRNEKQIYFSDTVLADAERSTFEIVNEQVGKDKNHVYCWDFNGGGFSDELKKIADPSTFETITAPGDSNHSQFWYYRDRKHIFSKWCTPINGVDVPSFKMVHHPTPEFDARDKNRKYGLGEPH